MFDISWTEFLLIGVVALVVIGPKELPGVLRTLGQWTRKVRSMAAEFQGQFQEAMREAEMADLKKQVDDLAQDIHSYDPLKNVRQDVEAIGKDIERSLDVTSDQKAAEPDTTTPAVNEVAAGEPMLIDAHAATPAAEANTPEPAVEPAQPDSVGRTE